MQDEIHALGPRWRIFWVQASDGTALRCGLWTQTPTPSRYVLLSNGRGEYIEKYAYLPEDIHLDADTAFLTWDHRGQGASGGIRFHIDSYDQFIGDVQKIVGEVVGQCPYSIVAHSMGSLIVLQGVLEGKLLPQAVFLSAPLLGFPVSPTAQWAATQFLTIANRVSWQTKRWLPYGRKKRPFEDNPFTHSPERYATFLATPFPSEAMTFGWLLATQQALKKVFQPAMLSRLSIPVHLFVAGDDRVVENTESLRWVALAQQYAPSKPVSTWVNGARHELLFESEAYYKAVLDPIKTKIGRSGTPTESG